MADNLEKKQELLDYNNKIVTEILKNTVMLEAKIDEKDREIETLKEENQNLHKEIQELSSALNKSEKTIGEKLDGFSDTLKSFKKNELDEKDKIITALRKEIETYKNYKTDKEELESRIEEFQRKLEKKDKDKKKYKKLAKTFKEFMSELNEVSVEDDED